MFRLILIVVVFMNLVFSQELTKEQEFYYNNNKISIETKTTYFWYYWGSSQTKYFISKGYDNISLEQFGELYGDKELVNKILFERERNNKGKKKWWFFGGGSALLIFAQDDGGRVMESARLPAISLFITFAYYHFKYGKTSNLNHKILPLNQVQDIVELYNSRLLKEIQTGNY